MELAPILAPMGSMQTGETDPPDPTRPTVSSAFAALLASMVATKQGTDTASAASEEGDSDQAATSQAASPPQGTAPSPPATEGKTSAVPATPAVPGEPTTGPGGAHGHSPATPAVPATPATPAAPAHAHAHAHGLERRDVVHGSRATSPDAAPAPAATPAPPPELQAAASSPELPGGEADQTAGDHLDGDPSASVQLGPDQQSVPVAPPVRSAAQREVDPLAVRPVQTVASIQGAVVVPLSAGSEDVQAEPTTDRPRSDHDLSRLDPHTTPVRLGRSAETAAPAPIDDAAASSVLERALAAQVTERVVRLTRGPDGAHEMSMELEPADLGRLELRVRLEAGTVHIHLDAHAQATTDLLRHALPELRDALEQAGLNAGMLDIGQHREHAQHPGSGASDPRGWTRSAERSKRADGSAHRLGRTAPAPAPTHLDVANGVDVLL